MIICIDKRIISSKFKFPLSIYDLFLKDCDVINPGGQMIPGGEPSIQRMTGGPSGGTKLSNSAQFCTIQPK